MPSRSWTIVLFLPLAGLWPTVEARSENRAPKHLLSVDKEALDELQMEDRRQRAAMKVIERSEGIRRANVRETKSKFGKMRELFGKASALTRADFKSDVAFAGHCVNGNALETTFPGLANVYVERDPLLGKQVYLVPKVEEGSPAGTDYVNMDLEELRRLHQQRRVEKDNFSALQFDLAKEAPAGGLISVMHKNSTFFTYRPPAPPAIRGRRLLAAGGGQTVVLFNARMDRLPDGMPYVIVQRLCPYYPGCTIQGNNIIEYSNYVDVFGYCYYTRIQYLPHGD